MYEDEIPVGRAKDLRGKKIGNLTVLYRTFNKGKQTTWKCKCDCGEIISITAANLANGQKSCAKCSYKKYGQNKIIDLTNQKFNRLTVIELIEESGRRKKWKCLCDCGNIVIVDGSKLKNGHTKSCGCLQRERASISNGANLLNKKFGFLTVVKQLDSKNNQRYWLCKCDCGEFTKVKTNDLMMNKVQSCGCKHESLGVKQIKDLLNKHNIPYTNEQTFDTCYFSNTNKKARFDFFIDKKYLLEYDGEQHFQQTNQWYSKEAVERDLYKNEWCKENNIPLIRIPYTKLNKITIEDVMLETTQFRVV